MIHSLIWQAAITPIMALNTKCNTRLSMKVNIAPHVLVATTLNILLERLLFLSSSTHPCYTHMLVFSYFWAITPPHCLLYLNGVINQNTYDHLWICFPPSTELLEFNSFVTFVIYTHIFIQMVPRRCFMLYC